MKIVQSSPCHDIVVETTFPDEGIIMINKE